MGFRATALLVPGLCWMLACPVWGASDAADLAARALAECESGRQADDRGARSRHFKVGEDLATRAVALDETSADAHFALFCNRGEIMRLDGETLSNALALRGLLRELDRTLELAPDHADALASKGIFLIRLPRLLGGDVDRGERMLRRVVTIDPTSVSARINLARICNGRGQREESLAFATRALQAAQDLGRADKVAEAKAMLNELGVSY
jgi:tetratricopeptide (TPR) repeat protein